MWNNTANWSRYVFLAFFGLLLLVDCASLRQHNRFDPASYDGSIPDLTRDVDAVGVPAKPRSESPENGALSIFPRRSYYIYTRDLHGRQIRIAFHKKIENISEQQRQDFVQYAFNIWDHYWHIFGGFPFPTYTILFYYGNSRWAGEHGIGFEMGYPLSPGIASPRNLNKYDTGYDYSHWIFHAWNSGGNGGINPQSNTREQWFIEGFTRYYAMKTLEAMKAPFCSEDEIEQEFHEHMYREILKNTYLERIKGTKYDIPLTQMGSKYQHTSLRSLYYKKGCLIAYMLDDQLHRDGSSLDELMRYMYQEFSYGLKRYRAEDIRDACSAISEKDYTDFFDKYVFGNTALPFDEETRFAYFSR